MNGSVELERIAIAGVDGVIATIGIGSTASDAFVAAFDAIDQALADAGFAPADIVRNRLVAGSREIRDAASAYRFGRLSGTARCASSSYIDSVEYPSGVGLRIDTVALRGAGAIKVAIERDPVQPPCRFIAVGNLVILSGQTSLAAGFDAQVAEIGERLIESLDAARKRSRTPDGTIRPVGTTIYLHRSVELEDRAYLADALGLGDAPITIARCDGYSKPGKLIEVEVDARISSDD
jgi:enamine deaminase RidA (YjgF/YER057c/UK114 family)